MPVPVRVAGHTFRFRQADLGISVDWAGAVASARSRSDGFGPLRGFRRLYQQVFGITITPATDTHGGKLDHALDTIVDSVGHKPVDASIALHGLNPVVVPGRKGISIDRAEARRELLGRFARLDRTPIVLPLGPRDPQVTSAMMASALAQVRTAVSAPVTLLSARTTIGCPAGSSRPFSGSRAPTRIRTRSRSAARRRTSSSPSCRRR